MKWTEEHGKELLEDKLLTAQIIKENYISKDKIRDKINYLENLEYGKLELSASIDKLKELL